ncbi:MAG: BolA family transcriptional regulator [Bdellovibrionales bacterium]|nr:BolA family transcriptional regulator [Bdellovibrionales bacterium]
MTADQLASKIKKLHPDTYVEAVDMTGTQDHWQVLIVSPAFEGKMMIDQQRMVMALLKGEIGTEEVHALTMKTYTPEQYKRFKK